MPSNLEEQIREILPLEEWKKRYGSKGDCFCSGFDCGKVGCVVWQEMLVQKLMALFSQTLEEIFSRIPTKADPMSRGEILEHLEQLRREYEK